MYSASVLDIPLVEAKIRYVLEHSGLARHTHAGDELPTHGREPRPVVPFGAPGSEVTQGPRAGGRRVRVSDEPAEPGPDDDGRQS